MPKYYQRHLKTTKTRSFFLFGPRGTGKTTWLKKKFPKSLYLDLLESNIFRQLLAKPERLEEMIPSSFGDWIILDEIQKIPELLNEVHRLIENKKYKFILTGSSARKLRKRGVNLLAGRAFVYNFYPLISAELGEDFSIKHSLKFGQLPLAYTVEEPGKFLSSYIQTYLKEEVLQEGLTRNIGNFTRFLEIASFSQGEILNISEIAREAQLKRKTVEGYFSILNDLLIAYRVPVFNKRAKRRIIKHDKFYFFDVGVFRALRPASFIDTEAELEGPALETLFLQEVKATSDYHNLMYTIYYWRTSTGLEVDFILYGKNGFYAIEIKRKSSISPKDLRGLKAFSRDYPTAKLFLLYGGKEKIYFGNITVLPIRHFFKNSLKILF